MAIDTVRVLCGCGGIVVMGLGTPAQQRRHLEVHRATRRHREWERAR